MDSFWGSAHVGGQLYYIQNIFAPVIIGFLIFSPALMALSAYAFGRRWFLWKRGAKESRSGNLLGRIKTTVGVVVGYTRMMSEAYPGWMHFLIFWGTAMFVVGKLIRLCSYLVHISSPPQDVFLAASFMSEAGAALIIIGGLLAVFRRYILKPPRLDTKFDDSHVFLFVFIILISGFMIKGYRIAISEVPLNGFSEWWWSPIGYGFSKIFMVFPIDYRNEILTWHRVVIHTFIAFVFLALILAYRSRIQHVLLVPLNVFFRSTKPKGALTPINLETAESYGASKIEHFTWKQLLDLDACTRCGRCQDNCPANISGKALSPKTLIQDLKNHMYEVYPIPFWPRPKEPRRDMINDAVTQEVVWDCTTCRACMEACPVYIEHIDKIVDMRRNLALERAEFPESAQGALQSLGTRGHPWRGTTATRTDWLTGLGVKVLSEKSDIDILYWVGCTASLEDRNMKVAIATAKVLQAAGVNFGVLGVEEGCCGDPARRMGDEYLYQTLCQKNIETMKNYKVKKIVTTCPHCFNTLKNEYPQFGADFEVVHHSQFIVDLINQGKLSVGNVSSMTVAYHDSCYLGRHNDIYKQPRKVLDSIGGIKRVELQRHGPRGFCCGGGGGHMWMEEPPEKRLNTRRTQEVIDAKANCVATACPYCLSMFEDGIKAKQVEETVKALDLSELVIQSMGKK
ncbi:MAG: (Fe-S)-binding protein [Dehalococcoidia bacterium]|nr:(Fe-S)-binding protein [Dehalococcoidia bacterium]